jgi:mRNA-degrading endonuclease RelE of RelBE toxin-antitoxin system
MKVKATKFFQKEIKRLRKKYISLEDDYNNLVDDLEENPYLGTPIGNDCYKVRLRITSKNKGKSGGARVITHIKVVKNTIYLLSIYDKSQQENVSDAQIKSWLKDLENE